MPDPAAREAWQMRPVLLANDWLLHARPVTVTVRPRPGTGGRPPGPAGPTA